MLVRLVDLPKDVVGVEAKGEVSREDYEKVMQPLLEDARKADTKINFLYYFGPEFRSFSAGAAWEDMALGVKYWSQFERCAVVADNSFIRGAIALMAPLATFPVQVFHGNEFAKAAVWLGSGEHGKHVHATLVEDKGIVVAEVTGPLAREDFNALKKVADPWIEEHHKLDGIVLHAKTFHGWENLGSFMSHVSFVEDHHRKVKRVALAADGKFPEIMPSLAKHFVKAKIRHFPYDQMDAATAWAAGEA